MRRLLRRQSRDRGAVSVEFVLIVPILLVLIFGIIQFAYYFFQVQQGAFAAREAARQAAVGTFACNSGSPSLVSYVVERVGSPSTVTVTLTARDGVTEANIANGADIEVGDTIAVNVSFAAADFGFPFIPYPNNAQIDETADTRVENVTSNTTGYVCSGSG